MNYENQMKIEFEAKSENEAFARVAAAAFISQLNPFVEEINDIKTVVSEAVTNSIIHGYEQKGGIIKLFCGFCGRTIYIEVEDYGKGIEDIEQAMTPLYTSKPDMERSGMGFTVMETFMDEMEVISQPGKGTLVKLKKTLECS